MGFSCTLNPHRLLHHDSGQDSHSAFAYPSQVLPIDYSAFAGTRQDFRNITVFLFFDTIVVHGHPRVSEESIL